MPCTVTIRRISILHFLLYVHCTRRGNSCGMSGLLRISNQFRPWLLRLDRASISTGNGGLYNKIAVVK